MISNGKLFKHLDHNLWHRFYSCRYLGVRFGSLESGKNEVRTIRSNKAKSKSKQNYCLYLRNCFHNLWNSDNEIGDYQTSTAINELGFTEGAFKRLLEGLESLK